MENYLLCGLMNNSYVSTPAIATKSFPLVLNQYLMESSNPLRINLQAAIINSLISINPIFSQQNHLALMFDTDFNNCLAVNNFNNNQYPNSFVLNSNNMLENKFNLITKFKYLLLFF